MLAGIGILSAPYTIREAGWASLAVLAFFRYYLLLYWGSAQVLF